MSSGTDSVKSDHNNLTTKKNPKLSSLVPKVKAVEYQTLCRKRISLSTSTLRHKFYWLPLSVHFAKRGVNSRTDFNVHKREVNALAGGRHGKW